ncbi:unnamed protein product [Rhizoctonia solani]|uniref:Uncharacterized protein n=2 Tax=Rhizoctonia solani TaxID=456999 RepID=A0A8H3DL21_9AGAM
MSIQPGTYMIYPVNGDEQGAGIGPVPLIYPPPTVPLRILPQSMIEPFTLKPDDGNTYQLTAQRDHWRVVPKEDSVFIQPIENGGQPKSWSIQPTGPQTYRVQLPNFDQVWTYDSDGFPQVTLRPANGSQEQNWKFVRIERD